MKEQSVRESNFELLRIVSMFFIILYHIIIHGHAIDNSTNAGVTIILKLLIFISLVHINSYVMVTGYFQSKSKFK